MEKKNSKPKTRKLITAIMLFALFGLFNAARAQNATPDCESSPSLDPEVTLDCGLDNAWGWYQFNSGNSNQMNLTLTNTDGDIGRYVYKMSIYDGDCTNPTLVAADSLTSDDDNSLNLTATDLTPNHTYLVRVNRAEGISGTTNFQVLRVMIPLCGISYEYGSELNNSYNSGYCQNASYNHPPCNLGTICYPSVTSMTFYLYYGSFPNTNFIVQATTNVSPFTYSVASNNTVAVLPLLNSSGPVSYTVGVYDAGQYQYGAPCNVLLFTVTPNPNPNFVTAPNPVCAGKQVCLTPTTGGANNYWTFINPPNANQTSSSSNPCFNMGTGNYTITHSSYLNGCGSYTTKVGSGAYFSASYQYTTTCSNTVSFKSLANCSGTATSFVWNFGDGSPLYTSYNTNITHTFPQGGTYLVQMTAYSGNQSFSTSQYITIVSAPTVTMTGPSVICNSVNPSGYFWVWTSNGVQSMTWTASPNVNIVPSNVINSKTITFGNIYITNYVYVTIQTVAGCILTRTFTIKPCCQPPTGSTSLPSLISYNYTPPTTQVVINGDVVLGANAALNLNSKDVLFGPDARLIISSNATLNINDSYLHACTSMWDGIILLGNSRIFMNNTYASDGKRVVVDSLGAAIISLQNFNFFKNHTGIVLRNSTTTNQINIQYGIITSAAMTVTFPINVVAYTSTATIGSLTKSFLAVPYNGTFAQYGIDFKDTQLATQQTGLDYRIPVDRVLFDKLSWGIINRGSRSSITRCTFQYASALQLKGPYPQVGGIFVTKGNSSMVNDVAVGGPGGRTCNFESNNFGILHNEQLVSRINAEYNNFNRHSYGIYIANSVWATSYINQNNFTNNGFMLNAPGNGIIYQNNLVFTATITANTINNATAWGGPTGNFGIYCSEQTPSPWTQYRVTNNTISGMYNGVYLSGTYSSLVQNNNITLRPGTISSIGSQNGIYAGNCYKPCIYDNTVSNMNNNSTHTYDNLISQSGILVNNSTIPALRCNTINDMPIGIKAQGVCFTAAGDGLRGNIMTNAGNGIALDQFAVIGDQYYLLPNNPTKFSSDNQWINNTFDTYAGLFSNQYNAPNIQTPGKIYTRSSSPYNIPLNKAGVYMVQNSPMAMYLYGTNNSPFYASVCNEPNGLMIQQYFNDIADGSIQFTENNDNMIKLSRRSLYRNITFENIPTDDNDALNAFKIAESDGANGIYLGIEQALPNFCSADSTEALNNTETINSAISSNISAPENDQMDVNQKIVNNIYLNMMGSKEDPDSVTIDLLEQIANGCPLVDGIAVLQARTLVWPYTGKMYFNSCEDGLTQGQEGRKPQTEQPISEEVNLTKLAEGIKVFPNPAQHSVIVSTPETIHGRLMITDISGRVVLDKNLDVYTIIDLSQFENGTYLYKITDNGQSVKAGKLVILK